MIHSWATDKDDQTVMPRWGKVGKQKIEDTGPLNRKRMETCDDEFVAAAKDFIKQQEKAGKPWFVWLNTTHMHAYTHTKKTSRGQAGRWQSAYHDTMIDHDKNVGQMLDFLDEMGLADDTFVQYSHRQRAAPQHLARRRHHAVPQREEHQLGRRVPRPADRALAAAGSRPARSATRSSSTTTGCRLSSPMAGAPDVVDKLKKGYKAIGRTYKNHIDGYNLLPYLTGKEKKSPRQLFFYFSDDGDVLGIAWTTGRSLFMEQRTAGGLDVWKDPFMRLRAPNIYNLRTDPYEFGKITSNTYNDWMFQHAYLIYAVQAVAAKFAATFKEFPAVQKPNTLHHRRRDGQDVRGSGRGGPLRKLTDLSKRRRDTMQPKLLSQEIPVCS